MKVLIVYAHPEPKSFNGSMFETAKAFLQQQHEVKTSDLYAMGFDPVSDRRNFLESKNPDFFKQQLEELHATANNSFSDQLASEQEKLNWCDLMIWQFPLWWFSVPGVLKGWVDRVFAMGKFYGDGRIYKEGAFRGKKALLSLTTGGAAETYISDSLHGDLDGILRPIHRGILEFTGWTVLEPNVVHKPARLSQEERATALDNWVARLANIGTEKEMLVGQY